MLEELQLVCMSDGLNVCCLTFFFSSFLVTHSGIVACMHA